MLQSVCKMSGHFADWQLNKLFCKLAGLFATNKAGGHFANKRTASLVNLQTNAVCGQFANKRDSWLVDLQTSEIDGQSICKLMISL